MGSIVTPETFFEFFPISWYRHFGTETLNTGHQASGKYHKGGRKNKNKTPRKSSFFFVLLLVYDVLILLPIASSTPLSFRRALEHVCRILRHGLAVTELAENDLPGVPSAVFAFKEVSLCLVLSPSTADACVVYVVARESGAMLDMNRGCILESSSFDPPQL